MAPHDHAVVPPARPRVLTLVRHYLPGFKAGGALRSVANLVTRLGDEVDFRVVTSDRDLGEAAPYPGVAADGWQTVGKAQVFYRSPATLGLRPLVRLLRSVPYDTLWLNSFFDPAFTVLPLVARRLARIPLTRCVLAPRGEFSGGALAIKAWKKRPFLVAARLLGLYDGLVWQVSSPHEQGDLRRSLGAVAANVVIAPDLALPVDAAGDLVSAADERDPGAPLRVAFLSRISPKKNLDQALRVLALVRCPVQFDVLGVVEDQAYGRRCRDLAASLPGHVRVRWLGAIEHERVVEALSAYDAFLFPTRGENYGHVVVEALAAGLSVLVSDQTPWLDLAGAGVGFVGSLDDVEGFVAAVEREAALLPTERLARRRRARAYAERVTLDPEALRANHELFRPQSSSPVSSR